MTATQPLRADVLFSGVVAELAVNTPAALSDSESASSNFRYANHGEIPDSGVTLPRIFQLLHPRRRFCTVPLPKTENGRA